MLCIRGGICRLVWLGGEQGGRREWLYLKTHRAVFPVIRPQKQGLSFKKDPFFFFFFFQISRSCCRDLSSPDGSAETASNLGARVSPAFSVPLFLHMHATVQILGQVLEQNLEEGAFSNSLIRSA